MPKRRVYQSREEAINAALCYEVSMSLISPARECLLLDAERRPIKEQWLPLAEAWRVVGVGCTPAANPAKDVIVLDVDPDARPDDLEQMDVFQRQCWRSALIPVVVASGRPGHRHLWVLVEDAGTHRRLTSLAFSLGLDVRSDQIVRLPLSPYYDNTGTVRLCAPFSPDAVVRAVRRTKPGS